jgi:hypothetical protein
MTSEKPRAQLGGSVAQACEVLGIAFERRDGRSIARDGENELRVELDASEGVTRITSDVKSGEAIKDRRRP